jgi:hypothetical protein
MYLRLARWSPGTMAVEKGREGVAPALIVDDLIDTPI